MGEWAVETYNVKDDELLTQVANYLERESSKKRDVDIWTAYFNSGDKAAFARINRETMKIELGKMANRAVKRGIQKILKNGAGESD